jgi:precorrin-6A/cobalt-precorrin-6A reductase
MILLLGGTSDTAPIALALAEQGHRVLVSKATEIPLEVGEHLRIETRCGPLDDDGLARLVRERGIRAIVDATHPYAVTIRARAHRVAQCLAIPHLTFVRPPSFTAGTPGVEFAVDHVAAARLAFADHRPVLLTIGARHLEPYARQAARTGIPLVVRALNGDASHAACRAAGLNDACIVSGRGPFSVEENRRQIRGFGIGVLVSKDSGEAGGSEQKLAAARAENCRLIVVARPTPPGKPLGSIAAVLEGLAQIMD